MKNTKKFTFDTSLGRMEYVVVDFLKAIEARPVLYDPKFRRTRVLSTGSMRNAAWNEIAFELVPKLQKLSEDELDYIINQCFRIKWSRMKRSFRKKTHLEDEEKKHKPYVFKEEMKFLLNYGSGQEDSSEENEEEQIEEDRENEVEKELPRNKKTPIKKELLNEASSKSTEVKARKSDSQESETFSNASTPPPRSARLRQKMALANSTPMSNTKAPREIRNSEIVSNSNTSSPAKIDSNKASGGLINDEISNTNSVRKQDSTKSRLSHRRIVQELSSPSPSKKMKSNISESNVNTTQGLKYKEVVAHEVNRKTICETVKRENIKATLNCRLDNTKQNPKEKTVGPQEINGQNFEVSTMDPMVFCEAVENDSMNGTINDKLDNIQQRNIAQDSQIHKISSNVFTGPIYGPHDAVERAFFESIIPSVYNMGKSKKIDFKIEVLQLLKKYQK
ncbi:uncharacterized protein LOC142220034 [Haematobia irritans]|uniref:uncharacterized protein LOC142220034 n=1 Tax=Haematobia irritans TaxID=7368 RepID=UPI003F4F6773